MMMFDDEDYEYYEEDEGGGGGGDKSTAVNESYPQNNSISSQPKTNTSLGGTGANAAGKAGSLADRLRGTTKNNNNNS